MKQRYVITLGVENTLWLRACSLEDAREIAGFTAANHGQIARIWFDDRNGQRQLLETVQPA